MSQPSDFSFDDTEFVSNLVIEVAVPGTAEITELAVVSHPSPPLIVVHESLPRGILVQMAPAALILVIALGIVSYRRADPVRYLVPRTSTQVDSSPRATAAATNVPREKILVRAEQRLDSPDGTGSVAGPGETASPQDRVGTDSKTGESSLIMADPVTAQGEPDERSPFEFGPEEIAGLQARKIPRVIPFDLEPKPPAPIDVPDQVAEGTKDQLATAVNVVPRAADVSKEDIQRDIEREGEQKAADKKFLSGLKLKANAIQKEEADDRLNSVRPSFRDDLKKAVALPTEAAAAEIDRLCAQYGATPNVDTQKAYKQAMRTVPARMSRQTEVEIMRTIGMSESAILEHLAKSFERIMKTRNGPRDEKEVKVYAAKILLNIPLRNDRKDQTNPLGPVARPFAARPNSTPVARP